MKNVIFRKTEKKKLLIIGHPRCGSGTAAHLCQQLGLDVGHEKMGADGISSWMFTVDSDDLPFGSGYASSTYSTKFDHIIHHVRNPFLAMPSIVVENRVNRSFRFRDNHLREIFGISLLDFQTELERAAASFIYWNYLASLKKPSLSYRIEDQADKLAAYLSENGLTDKADLLLDIEPQNTASAHFAIGRKNLDDTDLYKLDLKIFQKPKIENAAWSKCNIEIIRMLTNFCKCYNYSIPEFIKEL